ncbi:MAG: nitroreductase family protein [Clostridia bacterium]|nr:nitroreductase family protein [Clostridia bacterium]
MDFLSLTQNRQSCRAYNAEKPVEQEKLLSILEAFRLSPSACNAQPYRLTVVKGEKKQAVAKACSGMGMNKFAEDAPVLLVLSEDNYNKTAAIGSKVKGNDYRSIDIGIACATIAYAATEAGLSTCILGWFDDSKIRSLLNLDKPVRLVITLGYADDNDKLRVKKRKDMDALVNFAE